MRTNATSVRGSICPHCLTFGRRPVDRTDFTSSCANCGVAFVVDTPRMVTRTEVAPVYSRPEVHGDVIVSGPNHGQAGSPTTVAGSDPILLASPDDSA